MSKQPLITICVTSYNHKRFIRTCIDSLLNQTYQNLDIRVIDDCSTDGSVDILRSYGDQIDLTVRKKNRGMKGYCPTLNEVMCTARGEYYCRLDSDDFFELDYFERMVHETQKAPELDWICGGLHVVDADGKRTDTWLYRDWSTDPDEALLRGWQTCSVTIPHNGMFRTSFLQENELYWCHFPYGWGPDVNFTIRAVACRPKVKLIHHPGLNWRTHGENNSCDMDRRVGLALAVKEYYAENIDERIYLKNSILDRFERNSGDYLAAKFFLIAADIYSARTNFRVPDMFSGPTTQIDAEENKCRFDPLIQRYAERSLEYSERFAPEIKALFERVRSDNEVTEGRKQLRLGDFGGATRHFHTALEAHSETVGAHTGLGEVSFASGDVAEAESHTARALQLSPNDIPSLNNAGVIFHHKGNLRNALQAFYRVLSQDPACLDAHVNLLGLYATASRQDILPAEHRDTLLSSLRWISERSPSPNKSSLMKENHQLRDNCIHAYKDRHAGTSQRILLHRPGNGALKYLMDSWAEVLNTMGLPTRVLDWGADTRQALDEFQPTVFVTVADPAFIGDLDNNQLLAYRKSNGLTIGHITTLDHKYDPCDFYLTFHLDPSRDKRFDSLDRPLISLPFAINPNQHFMRPSREVWDFFFVGTNSHLKTNPTEDYLSPLLEEYSGILAGVNWPTGIGELPIQEAAQLYSFASICPNYHLQQQCDDFYEVNERTFIIPACGGFEIVDNPAAMSALFNDDEMAIAHSPEQYHEMFRHFLDHPEERETYVRKGMRRVYENYTLFHVLSRLTNFLGIEANGAENHTTHSSRNESVTC